MDYTHSMLDHIAPSPVPTADIAARMGMDIREDPRVVVYDIETDNSNGFGLDPYNSSVTQVSISDPEDTIVLDSQVLDEVFILEAIARLFTLVAREDLVLCGWNNFGFDNSFVAVRMVANKDALRALGVWVPDTVEEMLEPVPTLKAKYSVAGGFEHPQKIRWQGKTLEQIDVSYKFQQYAADNAVKHSLKPVSESLGVKILDVDRTRLHEYDLETRTAYAAGDTVMTLFLEQASV